MYIDDVFGIWVGTMMEVYNYQRLDSILYSSIHSDHIQLKQRQFSQQVNRLLVG